LLRACDDIVQVYAVPVALAWIAQSGDIETGDSFCDLLRERLGLYCLVVACGAVQLLGAVPQPGRKRAVVGSKEPADKMRPLQTTGHLAIAGRREIEHRERAEQR